MTHFFRNLMKSSPLSPSSPQPFDDAARQQAVPVADYCGVFYLGSPDQQPHQQQVDEEKGKEEQQSRREDVHNKMASKATATASAAAAAAAAASTTTSAAVVVSSSSSSSLPAASRFSQSPESPFWSPPSSSYENATAFRNPLPKAKKTKSSPFLDMHVRMDLLDQSYALLCNTRQMLHAPAAAASAAAPRRPVRLVVISDTHMYQDSLKLPAGDILIHAGDWLNCDSYNPTIISNRYCGQVMDWFSKQPHRYRIVLFANHDAGFERLWETDRAAFNKLTEGSLFLTPDTLVECCGITFRGTSWSTPTGSCNNAFQDVSKYLAPLARPPQRHTTLRLDDSGRGGMVVETRPADAATAAAAAKLDVLVTHCRLPKHTELLERLSPRLSISGHYHAFHGLAHPETTATTKTAFINAAILASDKEPPLLNSPIVIDVVPR